jgi:hypothetical protein
MENAMLSLNTSFRYFTVTLLNSILLKNKEAHQHLELAEVTIQIPVPSGVGAPIITTLPWLRTGDYKYDSQKNFHEWTLPVIGKIL